MIRGNTDITIVYIEDGKEAQISHIKGVEWQEERKVTVTENGLKTADMVVVLIPKRSLRDVLVKKSDFVVKGTKDYTGLTGKDLRRAIEKDGGVSVMSLVDNLGFVPEVLAHLELGCV